MDDPQPLPQRGSSQESLEMDILKLSARWEAQRTIRTGDTPGQALRKGVRAMRCTKWRMHAHMPLPHQLPSQQGCSAAAPVCR